MRLIFIRHAEPDYQHNCLTEKGYREAEILCGRTQKWDTDHIRKVYVSPLPRAKMTAEPTLRAWGMEAEELPWLREFEYRILHPATGKPHVPWDFYPEYFSQYPELYDRERWVEAPIYASNPEIRPAWEEIRREMDALLAQNGYHRCADGTGTMFELDRTLTDGDEEDTLVFFCHFGVTSFILAHLIGVSPFILLHHTVVLPTGITVVNAEKRTPDKAHLRIQVWGDVRHLAEAGEPFSTHAAFSPVFSL